MRLFTIPSTLIVCMCILVCRRNNCQIWARRSGLGQGWALFAHGPPCCASSEWSRQLVPGVGGH